MDDLDRKIEDALSEEDRKLMAKFGEQGLLGQVGGLFQGKLGWLAAITFVVATLATVIGVWAAFKFYYAGDIAAMLKWGALAWAGLTTQIMIKLWSWMRMESNRVIREVKRLELQIAKMKN